MDNIGPRAVQTRRITDYPQLICRWSHVVTDFEQSVLQRRAEWFGVKRFAGGSSVRVGNRYTTLLHPVCLFPENCGFTQAGVAEALCVTSPVRFQVWGAMEELRAVLLLFLLLLILAHVCHPDGQLLLPYRHARDAGYFTVPAGPGTRLHLRCELACPGPRPNAMCDITAYPPSPPSPPAPRCHILSDGIPDLHCDWGPGGDARLPDTHARLPEIYTLHWEPTLEGSSFPDGMTVKTMNATILRKDIQLANDMTVWVVANNSLGSVQSQKYSFNTGAVVKPRPRWSPRTCLMPFTWRFCGTSCVWHGSTCPTSAAGPSTAGPTRSPGPRENTWLSTGSCWGTEPFTAYVFRVRCACPGSSYWSDWSDDYTAQTAEAAPVGVVDVWSDSRETDQAVVWKELPLSQARGTVLAYEVAVEHGGGNRTVLNVTTAQAGGSNDTGACCRLLLPLLGVTAVTISAINSVGRTRPALLALPTTGDPMPGLLSVSVVMKRRAFAVSWDLPSPLAETIEEYVLQQEVAGLLVALGFDWTRANTTQRSIILTGAFQNYTPYSLSLFAVSGGRSRRLGSVIGYTRQGEFQVSRLSSSDATLTWQHIPLNKRMGVIQCYRLRQRDGPEHTVDGNSTSLQVSSLQPGQVYQFWIAAQTEAGAGSENTLQFSTRYHTDDYTSTVLTTLALFGLGLLVVFLLCRHRRAVYSVLPVWCFDKVPDLANSKVFLQTPVWTRPCPTVDSDPVLCQLEVLEAPPLKWGLTEGDAEEEEEEEEEESGSESKQSMEESDIYMLTGEEEEKPFFSGYEKHFMPSPLEV
ncbi:hypothetical protein COCON_G00022990 [Conger conger]|uniref:Fibronectin type-III domain-containing protein n=1 Tax=Conger conger TaxID=82655 RepID=A0A9Q1DXK6_CONCO|nr:hypothetical protein COCON_G00022990 [Conger conger]